MKNPDDEIYLQYIKEAIKKINSYVNKLDFEGFKKKLIVQDAVIRQFEIIGETTKRLSEDFKNYNTSNSMLEQDENIPIYSAIL